MSTIRTAYRSAILHSIGDPDKVGMENSYEYFADGAMIIENGIVQAIGNADEILANENSDIDVTVYENKIITSGFIDTHVHYPQTGMIASYGEQLLDWLNNYTFPAEGKFDDPEHATKVAEIFLQELMSNGTTTALVFGTVHKQSVDSFFTQAELRNLRIICGKVMMDRNAPDFLTDTLESCYEDSKELIERWHHKGRLHYAVTPRFAPTSTPEQLDVAARLLSEYPDLYMHTHLSENLKEIEWVKELFPERANYLDVYDHHGLLSERSVFAHSIHLCDSECQRLADTGSAVAFCPTSNLFLGSGLLDLPRLESFGINVGMGSDVGAGTCFSLLSTMNEAYKVLQLQGKALSPFKSLFLATLGGAKALRLDDKIGNLAVGKEADFVVLDLAATPLLKFRMDNSTSLEETLFALMLMGDDRVVCETYVYGENRYSSL